MGRALVNEVDVETFDVRLELVEPVQTSFLRTPIKLVAPVFKYLPQIRQVGAVGRPTRCLRSRQGGG